MGPRKKAGLDNRTLLVGTRNLFYLKVNRRHQKFENQGRVGVDYGDTM